MVEHLFFDRGPHGRVIGVPQHTLNVVGVRRVNCPLILHHKTALISKPWI